MSSIKKSCLGLTALLAASGVYSGITPPAMADTAVSVGVQIGMAWSDVGSTVGLIFVAPPPPVVNQPYYVIYQPTYYYYHPTYHSYRYSWWYSHYPREYTVVNRTYYPSSYYRRYGVPARVERTYYPSDNRTYSGVNRGYPNSSSRGNSSATTNTSANSTINGNSNTVNNTINNTTNIYNNSNNNANNSAYGRRSDRRYDGSRTPSTSIETGSGNSYGNSSSNSADRRRWRYGTGTTVSNPKPSTPATTVPPSSTAPTSPAVPSHSPNVTTIAPNPMVRSTPTASTYRGSNSGNSHRGSYGKPTSTERTTSGATIDSGGRSSRFGGSSSNTQWRQR